MAEIDFPTIGDIVLSKQSTVKDNKGDDNYSLLECDGEGLDTINYPLLSNKILNEIQLTASDAGYGKQYGGSVSIYGTRLVVGAHASEKVYIYDWNSTTDTYDEVLQLTASDGITYDYYGISVCLYNDRLIVGTLKDKVYAYDWNSSTGTYEEVLQLTGSGISGSQYGNSVSLYGDRLVVGASRYDVNGVDDGKVYIYDWNSSTGTYDEILQLTASDGVSYDYYGSGVSLRDNRLAVGAFGGAFGANEGKVYIYDWNSTTETYEEVLQLTAVDAEVKDWYGYSSSLYENTLVVGGRLHDTKVTDGGKVYIYYWNSTTETYDEVLQLTASDGDGSDNFGSGVSLYGETLVVGANGEDSIATNAGKVYIYNIESLTIPLITSPSSSIPYKIVADLQES